MKRKALCHSTIDSSDCPLYLRPYSGNSKIFVVPKEANRKPWCLLYDEPCIGHTPRFCGMMRHYKLKITITADAKLLDFVDSPEDLIVPLRDFVYRRLGYHGEHPVVTIDYENDTEMDDWCMIDRAETLGLLKNLSARNPTWEKFKKYCDEYEGRMEAEE